VKEDANEEALMSITRSVGNRWGVRLFALFILGLSGGAAMRLMAQEQGRPAGTAFVVHPDGYLLTAAHVVKDATQVEVVIEDKSYDARLVGVDVKSDLALLHIKAKNLPALLLSNSNAVQVGEEVRAFGFPLTSALGSSVKVTRGTVSGIETKDAQTVFQIDAAVNPGNSGGPLVTEKGEVIGVVNAKLAGLLVSNVGFAVPINYAKPLLRDAGVKFAAEGAKAKLDGPTLVRRVLPAVALMVVTRASPPAATTALSPTSPELVWILTEHSDTVYSVAFSPHSKTVASASSDRTIRVWDYRTGTLLQTVTGHSSAVSSVAFSPDGRTVASGSWDNTVRLWDAQTGKLQRTLTGHSDYVQAIAFSPDGRTMASGSADKTVRLWDAQTGVLLQTLEDGSVVESVAFSPDGRTVASGSGDNTVRLWDVPTGKLQRTLIGHSRGVWSVAFSPDGKRVASGSADKTVRLWDAGK
jgi:hypothetical protein